MGKELRFTLQDIGKEEERVVSVPASTPAGAHLLNAGGMDVLILPEGTTQEQVENFRREWRAMLRSAEHAVPVAIVPFGTEIKKIVLEETDETKGGTLNEQNDR